MRKKLKKILICFIIMSVLYLCSFHLKTGDHTIWKTRDHAVSQNGELNGSGNLFAFDKTRRKLIRSVGNLKSRYNMSIISAFKDPRTPLHIVILTISHETIYERPLFCHFKTNKGKVYNVKVDIIVKMSWWGSSYVGHFLYCQRPRGVLVSHVDISDHRDLPRDISLPVTEIPATATKQHNIAACVSPIHGLRYTTRHLVEWIELNRLLGVSHFVFYNYSMRADIGRVLQYYEDRNIATVFQWQPRNIPTSEMQAWPPLPGLLHYFGQVEALNDCLYRLTMHFRYLMFIDLDELISPHDHSSLPKLMKLLSEENPAVSGFLFPSIYLHARRKGNSKTESIFLSELLDVSTLTRPHLLGKIIIKSGPVLGVSVHDVERSLEPQRVKFVSSKIGRLLHYHQPSTDRHNSYRQLTRSSIFSNLVKLKGALLKSTCEVIKAMHHKNGF